MQALDSLIADFKRITRSKSKEDRATAFAQVARLYFASLDLQQAEHVAFFDHVLGLLVDDVATDERVEFSRRVAPLKSAPARLVRRLANDDEIGVAEPVIVQSEQLTSGDLAMLAQTKGQAHLLAISGRDVLEAVVTDALVARGGTEVLHRVTQNPGAEFNADGFARLAQKAQADETLAEIVAVRKDIPQNVLAAIITHAADDLRRRLVANAPPDRKHVIAGLVEDIAAKDATETRDYAPARKRLAERFGTRRLTEKDYIALATEEAVDELVVVLGTLTQTPFDVIERFMERNPSEAMPVLCRAADLSWPATQAVMLLCRFTPAQKDELLRQALANYSKLTKPISEKLLRFWFVRTTERPAGAQTPRFVERRKKDKRRRVDLPGVIQFGSSQLTMCTIVDLSMGGAKLALPPGFTPPERFSLSLSSTSKTWRDCERRWSAGGHVGVRFLT
jgi:uncharacterized protein (DUF2336 family)